MCIPSIELIELHHLIAQVACEEHQVAWLHLERELHKQHAIYTQYASHLAADLLGRLLHVSKTLTRCNTNIYTNTRTHIACQFIQYNT